MFKLANLPYANDALQPHMSAETLKLHHGKHHKTYIETLNVLLEGDAMADLTLDEVIEQSHGLAARQTIFNNAAQCWNHDFFWKSMMPGGGGPPTEDLKVMIEKDIGDANAFATAFRAAAAKHFGSGWIWLVATEGVIGIVTTHDAELPSVHHRSALLCCDLWEHAYYLDHQNRRADFVNVFLDHLVNWDFANANMAAAASAMNEEVQTGVQPNEAPYVIHAN